MVARYKKSSTSKLNVTVKPNLKQLNSTQIKPSNHNEKQQGFLLWMRRNGYRVVAKELVPMPDGSKKINLDVEMAVDVLTLAPHYDTAVLVSGNGNLAYAVDAVSQQGVRVEIVGLRGMTSDNLINVADTYLDIATIQTDIQKAIPKRETKATADRYVHRPLTSTVS